MRVPDVAITALKIYAYCMRYIFTTPNPKGALVGDCVIRAIAILTDATWDEAYIILISYGFEMKNLPNADTVWGAYLKDRGYTRHVLPTHCPSCYSVKDFCVEHPRGRFLLSTGTHVVAVIDGNYYDAWDSGDENPVLYWRENGTL